MVRRDNYSEDSTTDPDIRLSVEDKLLVMYRWVYFQESDVSALNWRTKARDSNDNVSKELRNRPDPEGDDAFYIWELIGENMCGINEDHDDPEALCQDLGAWD